MFLVVCLWGGGAPKQGKKHLSLEHFAIEMLYSVERRDFQRLLSLAGDVPVPGLERFHIENALPTARAGGRREGISTVYLRCYMPKQACLSALTL